jgi:1-acyl-sn-glycerol-3-phosphate acyltransferase
MTNTFIPSVPFQPLIELAKLTFPAYAAAAHHVRVVIDDDARKIFEQTEHSAAIICPNHPAPQDPIAVFGLSAAVNQTFHYMTAREVFREHPRFRSLWLEWLGCYSVARGLADRSSLRATKRLLVKGSNKVVIFPEGEITHQNARLMHFEPGPAQIALDVCKARARAGINEPLFLIPVAIVYRFEDDHSEELTKVLTRFESSFDGTAPKLPINLRIYNCFLSLLDAEEKLHRLNPTGTFSERLQRFLDHATGELELEMLHSVFAGEIVDRLHRLKSVLVRERFDAHHEPDEQATSWYMSVRRLTRLIAVNGTSFHTDLSQEEQAELLTILSWELLNDDVVPQFKKVAYITAGEPLDAMFFADARSNDSDGKALTAELQARVARRIDALQTEHSTLAGGRP